MKKSFLFTSLILLVMCASFVVAGPKQKMKNNDHDNQQNKRNMNSAIVAFNNLSMAIDFWHDASLKGNKKAVAEHKQMMQEIISADIKDCYQSVLYAKLESSYSQEELENNSSLSNKRDLKAEESSLNTKKLLYASLEKSNSFSYSYRLLADYLHILKKEINENKVEIADAHDNAGKVRIK